MKYATVLAALLCYAILTLWITQAWAWAAFQAGAFALAGAWIIQALRQDRPIHGSLLLLPPAGVVVWGLIQIAGHRTIYLWVTWKSVLAWTTWLAVCFLALQTLQDAAVRRRFLRVLVGFGCLLSVIAAVQMFTSGGKIFWLFASGYSDFVMGPFVNRDQYAAFIELLLPIALAQSLLDKRRWLLWCAVAGGMFASVVLSASRAGLAIAAAEIVAVPAIAAARGVVAGRYAGRIAGAFAGLAALFTIVVGWEAVWNRLSEPDPYAARREMLASSLHMIQERPWTGFGLGTWAIAYPRFALYDDGTYVNQSHNDWVQWTAEGGLPLLAILLALAILLLRPAFGSLWGLGVAAVLAHALVDFPFQQRAALGAWFFALAGALAARSRDGPRPERC